MARKIKYNSKDKNTSSNKRTKSKAKKNAEETWSFNFSKLNRSSLIGLGLFVILAVGIFAFISFLSKESVFAYLDIGSDSLNSKYADKSLFEWMKQTKEGWRGWSFYHGLGMEVGGGGQDILLKILNFPKKLIQYPFDIAAVVFGFQILPYSVGYEEFKWIILSAVMLFFYFDTFKANVVISFVSAAFIAFSGYSIVGSTWYHGGLFNLAFLLFAFEQFFQKKRWYFLPYAFFLIGGYAYYFNGLFLAIYALVRWFMVYDIRIEWKGFAKYAASLLGTVLIGLFLSSSSLSKTYDKIVSSPRGEQMFNEKPKLKSTASYKDQLLDTGIFELEDGIHYSSALYRSFGSDLIGTGSQFRGWQNYLESPLFYCGLLVLLLLPHFFYLYSGRIRWAVGALLFMWLALVTFPYLRYAFYYFVGDYYKHALNRFIPISLVFTSFLVLKKLFEGERLKLSVVIGTALVYLFLLYGTFLEDKTIIQEEVLTRTQVFILLYSVLLLLSGQVKFKSLSLVGLVLISFVELGLSSHYSLNERPALSNYYFENKKGYNDYTVEAIQYIDSLNSKNSFYRIEKNYSSSPSIHASMNDSRAQHYYGSQSYRSMNQVYYIRFLQEMEIIPLDNETATRWAPGIKYHPLLHGIFSMKYTMMSQRFQITPNTLQPLQQAGVPNRAIQALWSEGQTKVMDEEDFGLWMAGKLRQKDIKNFSNAIYQNAIISRPNYSQFGYDQLRQIEDVAIFENRYFVPFGFVYNNYIAKEDFDGLNSNQKQFMLNKAVVLEDHPIDLNIGVFELDSLEDNYTWNDHEKNTLELSSRTVQWVEMEKHHNEMSGTISLREDGMLFLSIPFDDEWKILVDGESVLPHLVNIGFIGVPLASGEHQIELSFEPGSNPSLFWIRLVGALLLIGLILSNIWYNRKQKSLIVAE